MIYRQAADRHVVVDGRPRAQAGRGLEGLAAGASLRRL
jgi:hypothetical protein